MESLAFAFSAFSRLEESYLWIAFSIVVFFYTIFSLILMYHWHTYGIPGDRTLTLVKYFYFSFTLLLLISAGTVLLVYSISL